ncbi:MBL fold metallo-hydrolase [Hyphococcus luteus]|uniref:MBL fold metallo-hydrolase n=1 Tax=Hyphococcus luteus TaxID=2058213 RepID=A0A2S7K3H7_9PROT|nr:MBL fold metallo-hydrolase [Marinicaulis flavus]PQA87064.1 MBL fold metallo-hydrolase [Marinicaulis flavus]
MASIPFVKDIDFAHGRSDRVAPGVRRVIANNPGPYTYTGSGTYIIGEGEVAVIDPGPDDDAHLEALLAELKSERVSHILVTHTHRDHCGLAMKFAAATGAPLLGFGAHPVKEQKHDAPALDEGADYSYAPDETIGDGAVIEGPDWRIEAVHTPGHLSNHLCFALPDQKALFTGDHIMGWATTVVAPPDGDMNAYLTSLDTLLARDDEIYFPTHGAPIKNPKRFVRAVKTHRLMRDAQILEQLRKGRSTINEITAAMYADVDKRLHGAAALNVLAHLIRLTQNGVVTSDGAPGMNANYILSD